MNVGRYSKEDYEKAGSPFEGFFNSKRKFISVNKDSDYGAAKVETHEGRHLLDQEHGLTIEQMSTLRDAYDQDFIDLPNTKYAGDLEGYKNMSHERVTTNNDARNYLFDKHKIFEFADHNLQDLFIEKLPDDKIFEAIENSNGYGSRYIEYLRDNGKLTHEKAMQFRNAMIKVGSVVPVAVGASKKRKKSTR